MPRRPPQQGLAALAAGGLHPAPRRRLQTTWKCNRKVPLPGPLHWNPCCTRGATVKTSERIPCWANVQTREVYLRRISCFWSWWDKSSFYGQLAALRGQLLPDEDFADFYCENNGRTSKATQPDGDRADAAGA